MATALLQPLKVQGGTFYTFASAAKDIAKTFTDDNARFVFSKYALLNLPKVMVPSNGDNTIVWQALDAFGGGANSTSAIATEFSATDNNYNLAQAFQSYALNFEQLILASMNNLVETYDESLLSTTSERIWWHFLKNINAIRWTDANTTSEATVIGRFKEEDPSAIGATMSYTRVVEYLGDIEIINNVSRGGQSYAEIYIHVPTSHGDTPLVLFNTATDYNFKPGETWGDSSNDYLYGRSSGFGPGGLTKTAYYDNMNTAVPSNQYILGGSFGMTGNTAVNAYMGITPVPVVISQMEGVVLDFDIQAYQPISGSNSINSINDFNASAASGDFTFNTCLVYYDTYDVSNPQNFARNLYGILIIDDYENGVSESKLKNFSKFKPNAVTKLNGNSYGLKLNLKFDTSTDNVGVETVIREDLTFGMDLFADASIRLQESADMFLDQKLDLIKIEDRLKTLELYYFSQDTIDIINAQIATLQTSVNNAEINFAGETTLLNLIRLNSSDINDILTGKVSVELTYNTDVVVPGPGIIIDQSIPNQISVENKVENYYTFNVCQNNNPWLSYSVGNGFTAGSTADGNRIILGEFTNYFRNIGATAANVFDNIIINIDDTNHKWKTGQTMRIVFADPITLGTWDINIKTDAQDNMSSGAYGVLCGTLTIADLVGTKPIIEIICIDEATYSFYVDVIK